LLRHRSLPCSRSAPALVLVLALVDPDALPVANGRIELARTTAFAAGPALGGALVGWIGGSLAFGRRALRRAGLPRAALASGSP
jgi:hypothetical protein